jgi:hypothetical protein
MPQFAGGLQPLGDDLLGTDLVPLKCGAIGGAPDHSGTSAIEPFVFLAPIDD